MAVSLTHSKVSGIADDPASSAEGDVLPSDWNAQHVLTQATGNLLGRTAAGAGAVGEISVSAPLTLAAGALGFSANNLTSANDTNVTLALGGTPTGALLNAVSITAGWTGTLASGRLNSNVVQSVVNDTNINGSISAQVLTFSWAGTLAAGRLNANVVQGVTNDTNVTGSIATQNLTLGWTGTLAAGRLNANVVQGITNDTNVTGSITAQNLTLGWTGTLGVTRGGTGAGTFTAHGILLGEGTGAIAATAAMTAGQILVGQAAADPTPQTVGTDATLSSSGALTIANSAVTNAKQANMAAWTIKMNNSGSSAAPGDVTVDGLTSKASPVGADELLIWDVAGAAMKKAAISAALSSGFTAPTTQSLTTGTAATYTTPANTKWIEVFMVGGGGGGSGCSTSAAIIGSAGGNSTFNSINANGGSPGAAGGSTTAGGAGGTGGTGAATRRQPGSPGMAGFNATTANSGHGGASYFGGGAVGIVGATAAGVNAVANSGSGGSGAINTTNPAIGGGGGGGEFVYLLIGSPAGTYTYTVGTLGAGGVSTNNGGAGGTGFIFVIEHYS